MRMMELQGFFVNGNEKIDNKLECIRKCMFA